MTITAKPFEGLKPGLYPATLDGYEEDSGEFGPSIKLIWGLDGLTNADGDAITKWQWVSQKLTPRSNLWNVLKTLGFTPVLNQDYEVDELMAPHVGARVQLMIKMVDGANGPQERITDMVAVDNGAAPAKVTSAKTPPAAAKKPLAQRLAEPEEMPACCVPGCKKMGDAFDGDGNAFCTKHAPEDE